MAAGARLVSDCTACVLLQAQIDGQVPALLDAVKENLERALAAEKTAEALGVALKASENDLQVTRAALERERLLCASRLRVLPLTADAAFSSPPESMSGPRDERLRSIICAALLKSAGGSLLDLTERVAQAVERVALMRSTDAP